MGFNAMNNIHGTAVMLCDLAVLLRGVPGSGKSDLALRLIDRGAKLVADDQLIVKKCDGVLTLSAPKTIAGLIEVRGLGIISVEHIEDTKLALVVDLLEDFTPERIPIPSFVEIEGVKFPQLKLEAKRESLHIIVEQAMAKLSRRRDSDVAGEIWAL